MRNRVHRSISVSLLLFDNHQSDALNSTLETDRTGERNANHHRMQSTFLVLCLLHIRQTIRLEIEVFVKVLCFSSKDDIVLAVWTRFTRKKRQS